MRLDGWIRCGLVAAGGSAAILAIASAFAISSAATLERAPLPALAVTLPCKVTEVVDGDTLGVEVTIRARVRLLDCWAAEVRTRDAAEKRRGNAAKKNMERLAAGKEAVLVVPLDGVDRIDDASSLGRVLGHVYVDGESVGRRQVAGGFATREKPKQE